MTNQEDPYELNDTEKSRLRTELSRLLEANENGDYVNMKQFLENREAYLQERFKDDPEDDIFRVRNRLTFDVYRKNYTLLAKNVPVQYTNTGTPKLEVKTTTEVIAHHPNGQPFKSQVHLKEGKSYFEGNALKTKWDSARHKANILTSVVYAFTLQNGSHTMVNNKSFVSVFHEQEVTFTDIPQEWQEVLGRPAFVTGFLEYRTTENPETSSDGVVNLFLKYRE